MARLKRLTKRLAIGLAMLIGMLLIANAWYGWWIGGHLEQRLARLRAAGQPTSFAELAPVPIPPDQDAAVHLQRLSPQLAAFAKEHFTFLDKMPLGQSFSQREDRGEPATPEQIAAIREILSHYPELPDALDRASRCDGYGSQIDFAAPYPQMMEELMSPANARRTPARFLRWKMTVLLAEGKQEKALQLGLVILRLARHYDQEPALVNGLVAMAVRYVAADSLNRVLRAGPISAESRQDLDLELAKHGDRRSIERVMHSERAFNLSASKSLFTKAWWLPWLKRGMQRDVLDYYQRLLPVITQPWHQSHQQLHQLNANVSYSHSMSGAMINLLTPAFEAAHVSINSDTARLRCLRIVNGLTAYAQENGQEAEHLDDLDLPDNAKLDPFSGNSLRLKRTDDGPVVYSIYKNGTDDDADFTEQADLGLGPAGYFGPE